MIIEALGGIHQLNYNNDELEKMVYSSQKSGVMKWYQDYS